VSFLLDTCVVSELVKAEPNESVLTWLLDADEDSLFLSVLTLGELEKGIARARDVSRKAKLINWVRRDLAQRFRGRVLPIDIEIAERWGALVGESERRGIPLPVVDSLLAATSLHHDLTIVIRNMADMERCGARCVNPWEGPK
jgi:Predicted nucleic acid-binding protein, contains PIN domain